LAHGFVQSVAASPGLLSSQRPKGVPAMGCEAHRIELVAPDRSAVGCHGAGELN